MWSKRKRSLHQVCSKDGISAHAWVVDATTNKVAYDPEFPEYGADRLKHGLTNKRRYAPFENRMQRRLWDRVKRKCIYPSMRMYKAIGKDFIRDHEVRHNCCFANAYVYQRTHANTKVVLGSFGWEHSDGRVWWAYG